MTCNSFRLFRFIKLPALLILCFGFAMGCATDTAIRPDAQDSQQTNVSKKITDIQVTKEPDAVVVNIQGNAILSYTSVKQPSPLGVILYFPETRVGEMMPTSPVDDDVIGNIAISQVENVQTSKIEIALSKDVPYQVTREGNGLKISFARKASDAAVNISGQSIRETSIPEPSLSSTAGSATGPATISRTYPVDSRKKGPSAKSSGAAWVNRIDFSSELKGKSTVIIGTTRPVEYRMEKISPTSVQLRLHHTNISDFRKLPLITTRFESAIDRIRPLQTPAMKTDSIVALDLREAVPYFVEQEGNVIKIRFGASSIPPRPDAPLSTTFVEKADEPAAARPDMTAAGKRDGHAEPSGEAKIVTAESRRSGVYRSDVTKVYTGEKMGIDFFDTDIRNIFRLLADYSGENFAIDKDVQGKVTLAFDKPVPWDQVLDLVLRMNQLDKIQEGGIIRIARLKTLEEEEKSKQQFFEAERKAKEQSLELEPVVTEYIPVNYAKAKDEMMQHVKDLVTPGRKDCSITVDERTNQLIVTDTASKVKHIRSIVQKLDRVTPQVVIEAKIVEATSDFERDLGITWGAKWGIQNSDPNAGIGPQPGYDTLGGTHGGNAAVNFPLTATNVGTIGFNFTRIAGTPIVLNAQLQAMESNNKGKIISAPKILTLDNKEANIEQGLEIGYLEKGKTDEAPTTKFKKVVLHLKVTPHITQDNRISMKIEILKDDVQSYTSTGVPTIATKKATTELLIDDGDTLVIGGITKTTENVGDTGVPFLGKIPFLGWLFRTDINKNNNEELLIFMTPRIVQL
ncbi:MAG: type IV pilus secretin PilQ [Deltaproteobacteria bacterium]|nr:type IV pilus secretin PilQ [Deltaproteobacteria bacterium]